MAISEKSIIAPESIKPGIPIKKSTLGVIALLIAVGTFAAALLMQGGTAPVQQKPNAEKNSGISTDAGNPAAIDEEQKLAKAQGPTKAPVNVQPGATAAQLPSAASSSPLPPGVRRENQDAALFDKALTKTGIAGPASAASGTVTGNGRGDRDVELEAQSRQAKLLAHDFGSEAASQQPIGSKQELANLVGGYQLGKPGPQAVQAPSAALAPGLDISMAAMRQGQPRAQSAPGNGAWLSEFGNQNLSKSNSTIKSTPAGSKFMLNQGKVIPATLGRKINSDLPGSITAFVTVDVYDSLGYGALLIPKGSVLVGSYNSEIKPGQERVLFAFQRLILPNGISFDLPGAQGADMGGASGMEGDVNNHFFKMFTNSFLVAWAADRVAPPTTVTVNGGTSSSVSPAGQVLVDVGKTILDRNKNIPPTITLEQGARINVEVTRDMEFMGPYPRSKN